MRRFLFLALLLASYFLIPKFSLPHPNFSHNWLSDHLRNVVPNSLAADFLLGIFTGKFDNSYLKQLLGDVGLQHVLAISGFHFSLLALLIGMVVRNILPRKTAVITLMIALLMYMLFVGVSPSLIRALISCEVVFLSKLVCRPSSSLSRLGLALIIVLLIDPHNAMHLGCQLSFLATAGILLFYKHIDQLLSHLIRDYHLETALKWSLGDQLFYILSIFFRRSIALGLSVNCLLLPVLLYYFNQFPPISLLYNLFFPFLVIGSMGLLLLGLLLDLFFLGAPIHFMNSLYTGLLLKTATGLPAPLKVPLYFPLSAPTALILVSLMLMLGIMLHKKDPYLPL